MRMRPPSASELFFVLGVLAFMLASSVAAAAVPEPPVVAPDMADADAQAAKDAYMRAKLRLEEKIKARREADQGVRSKKIAAELAIVEEKTARNTAMPRRRRSAATASRMPRTTPTGTVKST